VANICKVLVVDDHPLFRKGAAQLLELDDEFQLIGEAASGAEGIDLAAQLQPDLILLDLEMQDMSGIDVLRHLKDSESDAIIVVEITDIVHSSDKELNEVKGKAISDYQNYLEEQWLIVLRDKYVVIVNEEVLYSIIK